jgi:putative NADH-flavin reductase
MSHLFLLGATDRTRRLAADYALTEGHTVTALVREPARLAARPGLKLVTGTPEREADIEDAFARASPADGVVVALNNVRTSDLPWAKQVSPPRFMADAVRFTTDAMKRHGVERIAVVSAIGVGDSLARPRTCAG